MSSFLDELAGLGHSFVWFAFKLSSHETYLGWKFKYSWFGEFWWVLIQRIQAGVFNKLLNDIFFEIGICAWSYTIWFQKVLNFW